LTVAAAVPGLSPMQDVAGPLLANTFILPRMREPSACTFESAPTEPAVTGDLSSQCGNDVPDSSATTSPRQRRLDSSACQTDAQQSP
jgi:hypothetical protein